MSGAWRVTVDSWITPNATWFGSTTYLVSGEHVHSLPAALQAIAESPPEVYLARVADDASLPRRGPAPTEFNVPVCEHGRGRAHTYGGCVVCGDSERAHHEHPPTYDHQWHGTEHCEGPAKP